MRRLSSGLLVCAFIAHGPVLYAADTVPAAGYTDGFPKRRAGLWEVRSTGTQANGLAATQFCIGEKTDSADAHLDRHVGTKGSCTLGAFRRAGAAWVAESVCKEGRTIVVSKAIASGSFDREYRIDTVVTYDPPLGGIKREDKEAVAAVYLGPCLAHQRPGDMLIPGMGTLNMIDGTFRADPAHAAPPPRRRGTSQSASPSP
jgi:hypothetical protein